MSKKQSFRCKVNQIRLKSLTAAFFPIRSRLYLMHHSLMDNHNRVLSYVNKKVSTFEDISRQVQSRLDGVYARLQTTNTILLLYGVALTAISIVLLFV